MDLFVTLNRERGITFVISTHDTRIMGYARRLVSMRDGMIVGDEQQEPHAMVV
jgi:putative ABC transport system ATP-binding protein